MKYSFENKAKQLRSVVWVFDILHAWKLLQITTSLIISVGFFSGALRREIRQFVFV